MKLIDQLTWNDRLLALILLLAMATITLNVYNLEKDQKKSDARTSDFIHNINN